MLPPRWLHSQSMAQRSRPVAKVWKTAHAGARCPSTHACCRTSHLCWTMLADRACIRKTGVVVLARAPNGLLFSSRSPFFASPDRGLSTSERLRPLVLECSDGIERWIIERALLLAVGQRSGDCCASQSHFAQHSGSSSSSFSHNDSLQRPTLPFSAGAPTLDQ